MFGFVTSAGAKHTVPTVEAQTISGHLTSSLDVQNKLITRMSTNISVFLQGYTKEEDQGRWKRRSNELREEEEEISDRFQSEYCSEQL